VNQYFGGIPSQPQPPKADITEPRQEVEKRASINDDKANRPALAIGYHAPRQGTPEYFALGLIDMILATGKDSTLYQDLVQKRGLTGDVSSSINALGNQFDINGPTLYTISLFHDKDKPADDIIKAIDADVEQLRSQPVDMATLDRAKLKMRSNLYDQLEGLYGFGKADLLASFALFNDNPEEINTIEPMFSKVTAELVQKTAQEYLRPTNRTILTVIPGK
jgi:predicted Zn-dependent peptidase